MYKAKGREEFELEFNSVVSWLDGNLRNTYSVRIILTSVMCPPCFCRNSRSLDSVIRLGKFLTIRRDDSGISRGMADLELDELLLQDQFSINCQVLIGENGE